MHKKKRVSLQDIASQTGVTKMTVSRFLKNPQLVAENTRHKIAEAIETLGYIPNRAPEMLLSAKSHTIGVLIPSLTNLVFSEVLRGIESITTPAGYQTMLAHYAYSPEKEEHAIASLLAYNIDGLLLSDSIHTEKTLNMIERTGIPVIEMMETDTAQMPSVGFNNQKAAFAMTDEMIRRGYHHIVYLGARMDKRTHLKMQGYRQAMQTHHLTPHEVITEEPSSFSLGAKLLNQTLQQYPAVQGIFCTNDDLAIGAVFECQRQKIAIPQTLAIAGFHGHDVGQAMFPKLASVITPRKQIGKVAAQALIDRLQGKLVTLPSIIDLGFEISPGDSI